MQAAACHITPILFPPDQEEVSKDEEVGLKFTINEHDDLAGTCELILMHDALLAIGLLLSAASQFRLPGLPVGPGELCLTLWLALSFGRVLSNSRQQLTDGFKTLLIFWILFVLIQSFGTLLGLAIEKTHDVSSMIHDIVAYTLMASLALTATIGQDAAQRLRRTAWLFASIGCIGLAAQLADAWDILKIPGTDPWYWNRLRGWSENPNQLALLTTALALISLHLGETSSGAIERAAAILCATFFFSVGLLTRSDSLLICAVVVLPIFLGLKLRAWVSTSTNKRALSRATAWTLIIAFPALPIAMLPFSSSIYAHAADAATHMIEDNEQGETRLKLWTEAVNIGMSSGGFGFGPGPHLTSKDYKRPPPDKFEAHNTFLDLFTQVGFAGVLLFLWIVFMSIRCAARSGSAALISLMLGLLIFGMFHFVVRHPVFWLAVALCLTAKEKGRMSPAIQKWSA
jgi:hypothetical protein